MFVRLRSVFFFFFTSLQVEIHLLKYRYVFMTHSVEHI